MRLLSILVNKMRPEAKSTPLLKLISGVWQDGGFWVHFKIRINFYLVSSPRLTPVGLPTTLTTFSHGLQLIRVCIAKMFADSPVHLVRRTSKKTKIVKRWPPHLTYTFVSVSWGVGVPIAYLFNKNLITIVVDYIYRNKVHKFNLNRDWNFWHIQYILTNFF